MTDSASQSLVDLDLLIAVCEKAARSSFAVTIDPVPVLPVVKAAAARITELEAEVGRLRRQHLEADDKRCYWQDRALAAESELSRVEEKVRETLSPFEEAVEGCIDDAAHDSWDIWESPAAMCITVGDLRIAAELLRSLPRRGEQKSRERSNPPAEQSTTVPQHKTEN